MEGIYMAHKFMKIAQHFSQETQIKPERGITAPLPEWQTRETQTKPMVGKNLD